MTKIKQLSDNELGESIEALKYALYILEHQYRNVSEFLGTQIMSLNAKLDQLCTESERREEDEEDQ